MVVEMNSKQVTNKLIENMQSEVASLSNDQIHPKLAIVRLGEDPGSIAYEKGAKKKLKQIGIEAETFSYSADIAQEKFVSEFQNINDNENIHGILLLRPLPEHIDAKKATDIINPLKDVDGMSPVNLGKLMLNDDEGILPCTPAGVMEMLNFYEIELQGKNVAIVGHSDVVGKPLDILLLNRNATVTVCHVYTDDVKKVCSEADIVISATGQAGMITKDYLKHGAVVIDVGISLDEDGNIHGDVNYDEAIEKASYITPVPGGVGSLTTTVLAQNVIKSTNFLTPGVQY